jgi:UDP-N-acetylmuramoyl-tripeptide--D-alanyl-D-alanine ligase
VLLDDTYNANPDSVRAGIDVLAATVGKKILVLGDMGEIGEMSAQFHDEIGGYAKSQGVDRLLALGEASALAAHNFGAGGEHFTQIDDLVEACCRTDAGDDRARQGLALHAHGTCRRRACRSGSAVRRA